MRHDFGKGGSDAPGVNASEEESHSEPEVGHLIAVSAGDACDHAVQDVIS
jgi:hypothetical protein